MKFYQCKVRLDGSVSNEVSKINVTAAEIMMLRMVHGGSDAVVDIKETGDDHRTNEEERMRLRHEYRDFIGKTPKGELDPMMSLFGPDHLPLPTEIKEEVPEIIDSDQVADMLG